MASLGDITLRTDLLVKKYEKYVVADPKKDVEKGKGRSTDAFSELYEEIFADVQELNTKAEEISKEKNRARVAEKNAQLRRAKASILQNDIPKLQRMVKKGKKVSPEIIEERNSLVEKLITATHDISDGVSGVRRPMRPGQGGASSSRSGRNRGEVVISGLDQMTSYENPEYYAETDESSGFQRTWEDAKGKQDQVLDDISKGLSQLKNMGQAMTEELDRQDPLVNGIEDRIDKVNNSMISNNSKLKNTVYKMRSSRRICIDIVLILILLLVAYWIYSSLRSADVI